MKKVTGKVVSLVLALALVVTSFSANFAFASSKTVSGTLSDSTEDEIYLVNGSVTTFADLQSWIYSGTDEATLETKEHKVVDAQISSISHTSGDKLVKWGDISDAGVVDLTLRSSSVEGTEVLSILYKGTYQDDDDNDITVKGTKTFTVHVLNNKSTLIGEVGATNGESATLDANFAQKTVTHETTEADKGLTTGNDSKKLTVYMATPAADGLATWKALDTAADGSSTVLTAIPYTIKSSNSDIVLTDDGKVVTAAVKDGASTGSISFTAEVTAYGKTAAADLYDTDDVKVKSKIEKKILVDDVNFKSIGKYKGKTYLYSTGLDVANDTTTTPWDVHKIDVSGFDVSFDKTTFAAATVTVGDSASVTKISGEFAELDVNEGTVSTIDVDGGDVIVDNAKAGDITIGDDPGDVTVSSNGTAGKIDADNVTVKGGKTGDITADTAATISADEDDVATTVGAISAKTISIDSKDSKVTTGAIKTSAADATISLAGEDVTIKSIDFDYRNAALSFADFQGTIPAPVNATEDGAQISTTDADDDVTISGTANINAVDIEEDSKVAFTGSVNAADISGSGTLVIGAGKLYVSDGLTGVILKLSDASLAKGTTVFTAATDCVNVDDMEPFGFTLVKTEGSTKDTFKIDTLEFAGLAVNKTSSSIAKGYSETFTASAYPGGTALPAGYTVEWSLDDNDGIFELKTNADGSATVTAVDYDAVFASENKATLVATVLDADGDEDDSYSTGECALTAIAVPAATSDTTANFSVAKGSNYTMKVTSTTAPAVTLGTGNVFAVTVTHAAGSNDYFYKFNATGAIGAATGVYLNGQKLLVATVKAPFTIDTTKDVTVKGSYTMKITSDTIPTFGVGTAGVFNAQFLSKTGNAYLYKITSVAKAGTKAGIFVDGIKVFVATVG